MRVIVDVRPKERRKSDDEQERAYRDDVAQRLAALEKKFDDKLRVVQSKLDAKARVIDKLVNIVARDASSELQTLRAVRDELTQAMQA